LRRQEDAIEQPISGPSPFAKLESPLGSAGPRRGRDKSLGGPKVTVEGSVRPSVGRTESIAPSPPRPAPHRTALFFARRHEPARRAAPTTLELSRHSSRRGRITLRDSPISRSRRGFPIPTRSRRDRKRVALDCATMLARRRDVSRLFRGISEGLGKVPAKRSGRGNAGDALRRSFSRYVKWRKLFRHHGRSLHRARPREITFRRKETSQTLLNVNLSLSRDGEG